jgi:hypothetical protein
MKILSIVFGSIIATVLLGLVFSLPGAFVLMLVIGGLHSTIPALPAFGFGTSWLILIASNLLFKNTSASSTSSTK